MTTVDIPSYVRITIKNVNEAPMVSDGLTNTSLEEDFGLDIDSPGTRELVIDTYMGQLTWNLLYPDDVCHERTTARQRLYLELGG